MTDEYQLYPDVSGEVLPQMIVIWSGNLADVPLGWQVCDGTNGTPDLSALFVTEFTTYGLAFIIKI